MAKEKEGPKKVFIKTTKKYSIPLHHFRTYLPTAYPLLPYIMKKYTTCTTDAEVLFNQMLQMYEMQEMQLNVHIGG